MQCTISRFGPDELVPRRRRGGGSGSGRHGVRVAAAGKSASIGTAHDFLEAAGPVRALLAPDVSAGVPKRIHPWNLLRLQGNSALTLCRMSDICLPAFRLIRLTTRSFKMSAR